MKQSTINIQQNIKIEVYLRVIHGARICVDISLLDLTPVLISVFQACYQHVCEVLLKQQVLFAKPTWMLPEIMVSRVLG